MEKAGPSGLPYRNQNAIKVSKNDKETISLLTRVFQKIEDDIYYRATKAPLDITKKKLKYTGLQEEMLKKITSSDTPITETCAIDRSIIYNSLMKFYELKTMPTTAELYKDVGQHLPCWMDIRSFRRMLYKMGFIWRKIRNYTYVVIERPTITFERFRYLKNMRESTDKPVMYIEEFVADDKGITILMNSEYYCTDGPLPKGKCHFTCAITPFGLFNVEWNTSYGLKEFKDWLITFSMAINEVFVVVLKNYMHYQRELLELPTIDSLKVEMMEWLDYHCIPREGSMTKLDLYTLIETYTNNKDIIYEVDETIKEGNHTVYRLPDCISNLTPAAQIVSLVNKNYDQVQGNPEIVKDILESINQDMLQRFFYDVNKEICVIFDSDMKIDKDLDGLILNMSKCRDTFEIDSDFPSCSDTDSD